MNNQTYIIAEAGVNHNGSEELALRMIEVAKDAGADAVKFQLFQAEALTTKDAPLAEYQQKNDGSSSSQFEMLKCLELSHEIFLRLQAHAKKFNIDFIVTPFDIESLKFIHQELKLPTIKIGSGDLTNGPLLLAAARTGSHIILSTGMSNLAEIEEALKVIAFGYQNEELPSLKKLNLTYSNERSHKILQDKITLLHCTSEYPAPFEQINLRAMDTLKSAFNLRVGLSDHSLGFEVSVAAVAREATMLEKHFTLDTSMDGPDHLASLNPFQLKEMITAIRNVEKALGHYRKCATECEIKNVAIVRRSIVANQLINQGEEFSEKNLAIKRPSEGLSPMNYWDLLGKKAQKKYIEDEVVS